MQANEFPETFQEFIYVLGYGKPNTIDLTNITHQAKILDYFIQLLDCVGLQNRKSDVDLHLDLLLFPKTESFFSQLFASLDLSLRPKVDEVFQRMGIFIADFIGNCKNIPVVNRLAEKLKERFPHLNELFEASMDKILREFFQPTIGGFLDTHKVGVEHLKVKFPATHALFVAPLNTKSVRNNKLFNFYCNRWIYHPIMNYLALYVRLHLFPESSCKLVDKPLRWLEECLQLVFFHTTEISWEELTIKAHELCKASDELEPFADKSSGLLGEIEAATYTIKHISQPKDELIFLADANRQKKKEKNCDLMIIRHETADRILIEVATKSPRHGLNSKDDADAQTWDDFFSNFSNAILSYLLYLQKAIPQVLGLELTKCLPLLSDYEGSGYGVALPLVNDVLSIDPAIKTLSKDWSSDQKLEHVLRTCFFRPLVLDVCWGQLAPECERLEYRRQAVKESLQKDWVKNTLEKKTKQLEAAYQNQKAEGHTISKLYIALNLALSYRLLQDPLSTHDGNIQETADKTLHEVFQPFKDAFAAKGIQLELLLVKP